jgi:hypothetical protein
VRGRSSCLHICSINTWYSRSDLYHGSVILVLVLLVVVVAVGSSSDGEILPTTMNTAIGALDCR